MKAKIKKTGGTHLPSDSKILKAASTKRNLVLGLATLASVWRRGLLPKDLENHFLMTWLAYENGNVARLSKTMGLHRNTLVIKYGNRSKNGSTINLRKLW